MNTEPTADVLPLRAYHVTGTLVLGYPNPRKVTRITIDRQVMGASPEDALEGIGDNLAMDFRATSFRWEHGARAWLAGEEPPDLAMREIDAPRLPGVDSPEEQAA